MSDDRQGRSSDSGNDGADEDSTESGSRNGHLVLL